MRYTLVIFDFDGTLADSFPWFCRIFGELAEEFGFRSVGESDYEHVRTLDTRQLMRHLGVPLWKLPAIARRMRALGARDQKEITLFPGAEQMLRELKLRGCTLAIASSNSEQNVRDILKPKSAGLIDHYACGASLLGKAAVLARVLRRTGKTSRESIYIGDEFRDLLAARKASMAFGAVAWGYNSINALRERSPHLVFDSMSQIIEKLE